MHFLTRAIGLGDGEQVRDCRIRHLGFISKEKKCKISWQLS